MQHHSEPALDSAALPAEVRFLLGVAAASLGGPPPQTEPGLDWNSVLACVRHHRLEPLMAPALAPGVPMPDGTRRDLAGMRRRVAGQTMRLAGELARLARCFAGEGIELLALKGPALSVQLHGDPFQRSFTDLDLLVRPDAEAAALALLARCGYGTSERDVERCLNAVAVRHARHGFAVDLHTRLGEDERLLPTSVLRPFDTAVEVEVAGTRVRTLALPTALAYAAYHGAHHHWYRLQWLADFAAATRLAEVDWREVAAIARRLGAYRQLAMAARLSGAWLGRAPSGLPAPRGRDLAAVRRAEAIMPAVLALPPLGGFDMVRRVGRARILCAELALQQRPKARWAQLQVRLRPTVTDRSACPLPPSLGFLHYAVRFARLLRATLAVRRGGRS